MTASEACDLLVDVVQQLSAARRESAGWRLLAVAALHHSAELTRELEMTNERRHVCRRHARDAREAA